MNIDDLAALAASPETPLSGGYPSIAWIIEQLRGSRFSGKGRGREMAIRLCAALTSNHALSLDCLSQVLQLCPCRAVRPRGSDSWAHLPPAVVEGLRSNAFLQLLLITDPELSAFGSGRARIAVSCVWPSVRVRQAAE